VDAPISVELTPDGGVLVRAERAGAGVVTVAFTNGVGTWTQAVDVEVRDAPVWVTDSFGELREGVAADLTLDATNAVGFAVAAGALPAGLTLAADGSITGAPEAFGAYDVTVAASNGDTEVTRRFTGVVSAPLVEWVTDGFEALDRNVEVALPLVATHAEEFALTDGELPPGLELTEAASITGTPTEPGTFAFELTAYNASDEPVAREFELIVEQPELSLVLRAAPGDDASGVGIEADASGLAPASGWSVVLHSDPVEVAGGDATDEGGVEASATLPTPVPFGAHELRFSAVGADGAAVKSSIWFSVGETGEIEEISTSGPVVEPTRTPPPAVPGTGDTGRIAATGIDSTGWLAFAGALVLAGAAALVLAARTLRPIRRR
jgi:hypothetical protein